MSVSTSVRMALAKANKNQKELLAKFEESLSEKNYKKRQSFFDKIRDKFK